MRLDELSAHGGDICEPLRYKVHITLSKRNLLALLAKLDIDGSARTIQLVQDNVVLNVSSEDDATHYGDRVPGIMHPITEAVLRSQI